MSWDNTHENRAKLLELSQSAPYYALDSLVNSMYEEMAININKAGPRRQIPELLDWGITAEQIAAALKQSTS